MRSGLKKMELNARLSRNNPEDRLTSTATLLVIYNATRIYILNIFPQIFRT